MIASAAPSEFFEELLPNLSQADRELVNVTHGSQLRPIQDANGTSVLVLKLR